MLIIPTICVTVGPVVTGISPATGIPSNTELSEDGNPALSEDGNYELSEG